LCDARKQDLTTIIFAGARYSLFHASVGLDADQLRVTKLTVAMESRAW
jgi:hypothetical protein